NADNEQGFKIERSTDGVYCTQIATVGADEETYSAEGLTADTTYLFRVRAYSSHGDSGYSNIASDTTAPAVAPPQAPSDFTATIAEGFLGTDFAWTDNSNNETGFRIEVKDGIDGQ